MEILVVTQGAVSELSRMNRVLNAPQHTNARPASGPASYQRNNAVPQVNPAPKPERSSVSPRWILPA